MYKLGFLILSVFGFLDAAFLTRQHYTRDPLVCPIFGGCDQVTTSVYSEVFGIPIALLGALFYASVFIVNLYSYFAENELGPRFTAFFSIFAFLASAVLVYLMIFVIKAICFYCMLSALTSTLIFALGLVYTVTRGRARKNEQAREKEAEQA